MPCGDCARATPAVIAINRAVSTVAKATCLMVLMWRLLLCRCEANQKNHTAASSAAIVFLCRNVLNNKIQ
jgi:hypothetical protein